MCGIAGLYNFDHKPVERRTLEQMAALIRHRGPDDEGFYEKGSLGLVHRRLSILDLSPSGHQPMFDESGQWGIIYNGECYNFQQLREDLVQKGYRFRSTSDTEVILYGVKEYGESFVQRMVGMFAFAIWNAEKQELSLFRDRLGIKPLYYYLDSTHLLFASEIKPILAAGIEPKLEESMVSAFFSLRYTPGEKTLFRDIYKLEPGTWMKVDARGKLTRSTYWKLQDQNGHSTLSETQAQEKFYELLEDSLKGCLISDVPVGAFLSGGIDSSAITAMMKRHQAEVETFTFGMGSDIDESARAREVAEAIGVRNNLARLHSDDYKYYPLALWHLEEPIGDSIVVPTFLLAQEATKKVKVVELGEGADEILGGYVHQFAMTYGNAVMSSLPRWARSGFTGALSAIPAQAWEKFFPYPAKLGKSGITKAVDFFRHFDSIGEAYLALVGVFTEQEKQNLFTPDFYARAIHGNSPATLISERFHASRNPVFQNRLLQLDLRFWNTDYSMLRMDKLTMAHSIEARVPYLDHRLVEFCLTLPRHFNTHHFKQKLLMRGALKGKGILPEDVVSAKKKSFFLPIEKCFDSAFDGFVKHTLRDEAIEKRGIFQVEQVRALRENPQRELLQNKQLMLILCFELWAQSFLDGNWRTSPAL